MPSFTMPRAVIFDWDNTLVDSWPVIQDALNTTFRAYGLPEWSLDETRTKVRKSMRDSFPALFGDAWEEAGDVFYERYSAIHADLVQPLPGVPDIFQALKDNDAYLCIVSNKKGSFLRIEAEHLGWSKYFGNIVGAFDAARDKPDPAPVYMALEPGGIAPGPDVWFAGDADVDLTCGAAAGCLPVLIRPERPGAGEFPEHPPIHHFETCEHLCKILKSM